ncbi:hypothetical protein [Litorisediminicola beolgyonensis]|uniref:Phytanoyl-CoA dioxygenase (PhyH) n=1 Tax=Litorisediminicola beolgyonensis TaxID=1173614 RepID=A0ABW3ZKB0_9RHOB
MSALADTLTVRGWARLTLGDAAAWTEVALARAREVIADPGMRARWLTCEDTWFVGVDALPSAPDGSVDGVPLPGTLRAALDLPPLHPAQISAVWPGYPRPRDGESEAAFGYRLRRDGAHLDGVLKEGGARRVREPHAFILGLPMTAADPGASPLVVWERSHDILRDALSEALSGHPPERWSEVDVTDAYTAARRAVFERCERVPLPARPGEAILLHRLLLHGIAPWEPGAQAAPEGRIVAYFRPPCPGGVRAWLGQETLPSLSN